MKPSTLLRKKLSSYSAFTAAVIAGVSQAKAQVIYTNLDPDVNLKFGESYILDLNNDGITDFSFKVEDAFENGRYRDEVGGYELFNSVNAKSNTTSGYPYKFPYALNNNDSINALDHWMPYGLTDSSGGILYQTAGSYNTYIGFWKQAHDKFLGLRIYKDGNFYYGWARLTVYSSRKMRIKDYAYNATPNAPILAGEGLLSICTDNVEPNNGFNQAAAAVMNSDMSGLINPASDQDFFKFDLPEDQNNMRVTLTHLPKNYNLFLYDQNYQLVAKSTHSGKVNEKIIENNATAQTYYVKVRAHNPSTFDADSCYTLLIETSDNPFRIDQNQNTRDAEEIVLYPNPAQDKLWISGISESAEVIVYDMLGRALSVDPFGKNPALSLDLSSFPNGIYFLKVKSDSGTVIKKFVVQK